MSQYIRYVSVYIGPQTFKKLKDEYLEAWGRMEEDKSLKIIYGEDIRPENFSLENLQLHSHLMFKVTVDSRDADRAEIIEKAINIIAYCLHPEVRDDDSLDPGHHPLFDEEGRILKDIPTCEWSSADVDRQFLAHPRICAEDLQARAARRQRLADTGISRITYNRDSMGNLTSNVPPE